MTLRAGRTTLENAIDQIAAAAKVRVSYSAEQLPLDASVCASYRGSVGDVLTDLLKGVRVQAVVAGVDHVVLTPSATHAAGYDEMPEQEAVFPLQPVIATAVVEFPAEHPGYATTRVARRELVQQRSIPEAVSAYVPGVWAWQSPIGFTTQYSARGAASFGATAPKVYIDGIEVANPLLVTQLQPENIERIEVIRGPQGGALYGADAISGVTNIVTRHDDLADDAPRIHVRSGLSLAASSFIATAGLSQDHNLSMQLGSRARSGSVNVTLGNVGEYLPGAFSRHVGLDGNMRVVGERTLLTGTARFFSQSAGNPTSVLSDSLYSGVTLGMQQYTIGTRLSHRTTDRLTHAIVLGIDGYTLNGVPRDSLGGLSVADSVLRAAGDGGLRTTVRLSSAVELGTGVNTGMLTVMAEHSSLHQYGLLRTAGTYGATTAAHGMHRTAIETTTPDSFDETRSSQALAAQLDGSLFERLSVTGAVRVERDAVNGAVATNTLPMLAASYVLGGRDANVRLRTSYGKAIRWPNMPAPVNGPALQARMNSQLLTPEQQSGLELGMDVTLKELFGLQLTRYDQTASGLMQSVLVTDSAGYGGMSARTRYVLQSVGEIHNVGWELQAFLEQGPLSLNASLAMTDSRVLELAAQYAGDLQVGDRMLAVPARTASVSAAWQANTWSIGVSAARAFDWINYDRLRLLDADAAPSGAALRSYWREYDGLTHLRATLSRAIRSNLLLVLAGDNLLGGQTGEPDNLTVVPGRTISVGVRASF